MNRLRPEAILFDFDGVILESVGIKTDAFRELFKTYPAKVNAIVQYHLQNGGVNRTEKFAYIYRKFLRRPLTEVDQKRLGIRFSNIIQMKMLVCRYVPGALRFLKSLQGRVPVYVASATPERELKRIIKKRGIQPFFKRIFGHPTSKRETIRSVIRQGNLHPSQILYVGDSLADWKAARAEGILFVARKNPELPGRFPRNVRQVNDLSELHRWFKASMTSPHPK
jgi:HAD superfamily hydrolase (TIGR01549 family)